MEIKLQVNNSVYISNRSKFQKEIYKLVRDE